MTGSPPTVLIIDDNQGDITLLKEAIHEHCPEVIVHVMSDAREVIAALRMSTAHSVPNAMVLDFNMPAVNGLMILQEIAKHEAWVKTPVIVCTGNHDPNIFAICRKAGATKTVEKPSTWEAVQELAKEICDLGRVTAFIQNRKKTGAAE